MRLHTGVPLVFLFVTLARSERPRAEHHVDAAATSQDHRAFMDANDVAMKRMMAGMTIRPTGDIDKDFVEMMVPHHQGAIDMAVAELRYGHDEQLKRLAQEIIVTQQQEITAMRLALNQPLPQSAPSPTTPTSPHHDVATERGER